MYKKKKMAVMFENTYITQRCSAHAYSHICKCVKYIRSSHRYSDWRHSQQTFSSTNTYIQSCRYICVYYMYIHGFSILVHLSLSTFTDVCTLYGYMYVENPHTKHFRGFMRSLTVSWGCFSQFLSSSLYTVTPHKFFFLSSSFDSAPDTTHALSNSQDANERNLEHKP